MDTAELRRLIGSLTDRIASVSRQEPESPERPWGEALMRSLSLTLTCVLQGRDPADAVGRPFNCCRIADGYELRFGHHALPVEPFRIRRALADMQPTLHPGETILVDPEWATLLMEDALAAVDERVERIEREHGSFTFPIVNTMHAPLRERARILRQALFAAARVIERRVAA